MPQARIAMRSIHQRKAFSKEDILRSYAGPLTLRGFRVDHPELVELERSSMADDWMNVVQKMPGRVPNTDPQLTGFVAHLKTAYLGILRLQEEGDFQGEASSVAQRALTILGQFHKWLSQQGDDRASIMESLEGEGAAEGMTGWADDAGSVADLCRKVLLVVSAINEDVIA